MELFILEQTQQTSNLVNNSDTSESKLLKQKVAVDTLVCIAQIATWSWDPQQDKLNISSNFYALLKLPDDINLTNQTQKKGLLHPDDIEKYEAFTNNCSKENTTWHIEYRMINPLNGALIYVEEHAKSRVCDGKKTVTVDGIIRDITHHKKTEETLKNLNNEYRSKLEWEVAHRTVELKNSKDLLQAILDSSSSYISVQQCIRNEHGEVIDFEIGAINKLAKTFLENYDSAGKRFSQVFPEVIASGLLEKMIETAETGISQQFVIQYPEHWFEYSLSRLEDSVVCNAQDITIRRKAESEVLRLTEEQLRNNEERQAFLLELSDMIRTLDDPMDIQREAAALLGKRLNADRAYYAEFDDDLSIATIYRNTNVKTIQV